MGANAAPVDTSWGTMPDVNGDGHPDVLVGSEAGNAYLYLSGPSGLATTPIVVSAPSDLSIAGDINGDGFVDVIAGDHSGQPSKLFLGSATGLQPTPMSFTLFEPVAAGDVNADGYADVIAGGSIRMGSATGLSATTTQLVLPPGSQGEQHSASAGDFNGDGFADIVLVDPTAMGAMQGGNGYIYLGGSSGPSATPLMLDAPADTNDALGFFVVTCAGDVNGDGLSDVVLSGNNLAYVFLGAASGPGGAPIILMPPGPSGQFAVSLASAGDVNGDGFSDVIVGDWGANSAYVYFGAQGGFAPGARPLRVSGGAQSFGYNVSGAGDLDNDGYGDVIVGAPGPISSAGAAAAYIFHGTPAGGFGAPTTLTEPAGSASFGWTVASRSLPHHIGDPQWYRPAMPRKSDWRLL